MIMGMGMAHFKSNAHTGGKVHGKKKRFRVHLAIEKEEGRFNFNFESPCVFLGEWCFKGQSSNKQRWHGICSSGKPRPKKGWSCKALTASCSAQAAGLLLEEYWVAKPKSYGCPFKENQ